MTGYDRAAQVLSLITNGEPNQDPFARLDLLERAIGERLPEAKLVTYPKLGHSLKPVLDEALEEVATFVRRLERRGRSS